MPEKSRSKKYRVLKKDIGYLPYNMGHILYMAQLAGSIEKKKLVSSMPKHERERYEQAFEALVKENILLQTDEQRKKDSFTINPEKKVNARDLIHRFVRGIREEKRDEPIQRNPFFHRGPIKDIEHFIGRHEIISHIFDRLRHTEDCSIIGPRAIGKTSLLHYLSHGEVVRKYHLDPKIYLFVYYDLERFGKNTEVKDFYYEMFSRTVSQIYSSGQISEEYIKKINEEAGEVIKKINKSMFDISDLENLIGALSERNYNIVYLFDEFESVASNPTFDFSFYGQLRAFSGNPSFKVSFITASKKSIYELTFTEEIKTSPFFRYFEDFELGPMNVEDIREFFDLASEKGVVFSGQMRTLIEEWSGRHPFLVQLACDYFFDLSMNKKISVALDEEKHLEKFISQHKKHFAYFWKQVNKEQQACLWRLASDKSLGRNCKDILDNLEESYMVILKNGNYKIFSKAFEKFVKDMPPPKTE